MATKAAALQAWLEGFGLPVYRDSAVPGEAKMPYMWVMQGEPFCNAMADEDNAVKRRIINLTIEYMTSY